MTFGIRLQQIREARGISRRDLAARSGVAPSYIEKVERGYNGPPAALTILDMAKALRTDADELFALSGKLSPDLERLLLCSPTLVLLVRIAASWKEEQIHQFLLTQGVEPEKLKWAAINPSLIKTDERRSQREPVTEEMKRTVFSLDSHECVYCSSTTLLEVDHIYPVSLGRNQRDRESCDLLLSMQQEEAESNYAFHNGVWKVPR